MISWLYRGPRARSCGGILAGAGGLPGRARARSRRNRRIYAPLRVPPPSLGGHTADMSRISVAVIDGQRTFADALASRLAAEPDMQLVVVSESTATARRLLSGRH